MRGSRLRTIRMNKLRTGPRWRESDKIGRRFQWSRPTLSRTVRRPCSGRRRTSPTLRPPFPPAPIRPAHLRRRWHSVPRRPRPPPRGIGLPPGRPAIDRVRSARAWRPRCARSAHPESRIRVTFAPPALFASVEAFEPLPESLYESGAWCVTVPLRRERPQAKDTRFLPSAQEAYRDLPPGAHEGLLVGGGRHAPRRALQQRLRSAGRRPTDGGHARAPRHHALARPRAGARRRPRLAGGDRQGGAGTHDGGVPDQRVARGARGGARRRHDDRTGPARPAGPRAAAALPRAHAHGGGTPAVVRGQGDPQAP